MATLTIRDLDDELMARLRLRAMRHGQSMEDAALSVLRAALMSEVEDNSGASLCAAIRARVESFGGVELELPRREPQPDPPDFGGCSRWIPK
jgi:plasmid stability protein